MRQTRLAIIGAGGYGDYCLGLLERFVDPASYRLVAAIDPFYERVPRYEALRAAGVPFYRTPGGILRRRLCGSGAGRQPDPPAP